MSYVHSRSGPWTPSRTRAECSTCGAIMRISGQRARSGVNSMGNSAGSAALILAVTRPMHSDRPRSTARQKHNACFKVLIALAFHLAAHSPKAYVTFDGLAVQQERCASKLQHVGYLSLSPSHPLQFLQRAGTPGLPAPWESGRSFPAHSSTAPVSAP
jgi:hypothetical protein